MSAPSTPIQQQSYVPLFEGENYDFWCVRVRILFISLDLWDLVEEGFKEPKSIEDLSQAPVLLEKFNKKCPTQFFQELLVQQKQKRHGIFFKMNSKGAQK